MILVGEYTQLPEWLPAQPGSGILVLRRDSDGTYKEHCICSVPNPSYLVADGKDGLFAVEEGNQGGLTRCAKMPDGSYAAQETVHFPGGGSCHVCLDRRTGTAFVSNYSTGSLAVINCALGSMRVVQELRYSGNGTVPSRQEAPHIHSSCLSPDGGELFVADLGTDRVYRYLRRGKLCLEPNPDQPWIVFPPGSGPRHMSFHPTLPAAYVTGELSNQVFLIWFDPDGTGRIEDAWSTTQRTGSTILTAHLQFSSKFGMLYACVRGADELVWFSVEDDGRLTPRGRCPSSGRFPRHFLLDEEDGRLIAANQLSGDVCVFQIDACGDLLPEPLQRIAAPSAAVVVKV